MLVLDRRWMVGLIALAIAACGGDESGDDTEDQESALQDSRQLKAHTAGKACKSDKDCKNGSCKQELPAFPFSDREAQPAPGGFCSFACGINVDCGEGGSCIGAGNSAFGFDMPDAKGLCVATCDEDTPCREGYACVDLFWQIIGSENALEVKTGSCQPLGEPEEE